MDYEAIEQSSFFTANAIGLLKGLVSGVLVGAVVPRDNYSPPTSILTKAGVGALLSYGADLVARAGLQLGGPENWENNLGTTAGFVVGYTIAESGKDMLRGIQLKRQERRARPRRLESLD